MHEEFWLFASIQNHFWLICGVLCGLGGSAIARFQLKKRVEAGELVQAEVSSFVRGMAVWIFVPCLILWLLQLSVRGVTQPDYLMWPSAQKYIAVVLQAFIWLVLAWWVLLSSGAATLSRFSSGFFYGPEIFRTPTAFKVYAVGVILSGGYTLAHL